MKPILPFKDSVQYMQAGSLMALGAEAKPDPGAMQRVARRVGVSSAVLAAAQAAAMKAAAEVGSSATVTNAVAMGDGAHSVFVLSVIKGVAVGLCVSSVAYLGAHLTNTSASPSTAAVGAPARHIRPQPADTSATVAAMAPVPSAIIGEKARNAAPHRSSATPTEPGHAPASAGTSVANRDVARGIDTMPGVASSPGANEAPPPIPSSAASANVSTTGAVAAGAGASQRAAEPPVMREVMSLDRVRTLAKQGNPALALRELDDFDRVHGYRLLPSEAKLVRIDVLLSLGMRPAAASVARQLLQEGAPATQRHRLTLLANSGAAPSASAGTLK